MKKLLLVLILLAARTAIAQDSMVKFTPAIAVIAQPEYVNHCVIYGDGKCVYEDIIGDAPMGGPFLGQNTPTDTISVSCSEDYYLADAQFSLTIDGTTVTAATSCTFKNPSPGVTTGTPQVITFTGSWGTGVHSIVPTFINDAWGGTPATDRNLYIRGISYDGATATPTAIQTLSRQGDSATYTTTAAVSTKISCDNGASTFTTTLPGYTAGMSCTSKLGTSSTGAPTLTINVTTTVTHTVQLGWNAVTTCTDGSPCTPDGYIVYKGITAGGPYGAIATGPALGYTDGAVSAAQTLFYVVKAFSALNGQSANSAEVKAVVPTP
jgi:hypothetical protein